MVVAAVLVACCGAWTVRGLRPHTAAGLLVAAAAVALPTLGGVGSLPPWLRAAALAAEPLVVAGLALTRPRGARAARRTRRGGRGYWPRDVRAAFPRGTRSAVALASAAAAVHLVGYEPFDDPNCPRTCDPLGLAFLDTRTTVLIVTGLLAAATVAMASAPMSTAVAAAAVVAAGWGVRWAWWEGFAWPDVLIAVGPLAVAGASGAVWASGLATLRTRRALERLAVQLATGTAGPIRAVHFAVPGTTRWIDASGWDAEPPEGTRTVAAGPGLRLLVSRHADPGDVLAGLTPAIEWGLRNARLAALAHVHIADVRASQRRVVAAADAERRRIERDLHDGAQQRLVSAAFQLRLARARVGQDADQVAAIEDAVHKALASLRTLSHGLFPRVLADEGLAAALDDLVAASGVRASLDVRLNRVPDQDTAMAIYAAVARALDHPARTADIVVSDDPLTARIETDAVWRTDLTEIADRVGAVGGHHRLSQEGTVLTVVIP
ncbi:hypothetical protein GCM10009555_018700 [Acrocarpospora macrocephala]|uniref:histidine kinase n=1 Tax=Acrocarpospora macrocephala TaxID=150177 RepID=A0A5M3WGV9_9ACTN|nr:hypothetical protein Amac_011250 [Acrocarpospora macrocephala]